MSKYFLKFYYHKGHTIIELDEKIDLKKIAKNTKWFYYSNKNINYLINLNKIEFIKFGDIEDL